MPESKNIDGILIKFTAPVSSGLATVGLLEEYSKAGLNNLLRLRVFPKAIILLRVAKKSSVELSAVVGKEAAGINSL